MRIYGNAGALVTATGSVDLPTAPIRHRDTLADPASKWAIRSPIPAQSEPGAPPAAPVTKAAPVARRMTDREYAAKAAARAAEQARRDLLEVERRHVNPEAERRRVQDTPDRTAARRAVLVAESLWHERNCACLATLNGRRPA